MGLEAAKENGRDADLRLTEGLHCVLVEVGDRNPGCKLYKARCWQNFPGSDQDVSTRYVLVTMK